VKPKTKSPLCPTRDIPDGQLIVGSYNYSLYSLATSGRLNGHSINPRIIISEIFGEQSGIFAPSAIIICTLTKTKLLWEFPTNDSLWAKPTTDDACECIFLTSMDHQVYAIDAQSGEQKWITEDLGGAIVGTPAISEEGRLYVGTFGNEMIAMDTNNGKIIWRYRTEDWVWSGPALDGEVLYFGDLNGNLYAINAVDGSVEWKIKPNGKIVGTPLVIDDMIVFTTETDTVDVNNVYAYDKEGNPVATTGWRKALFISSCCRRSYSVAPVESDLLALTRMAPKMAIFARKVADQDKFTEIIME
jgi:outer membrane protein assembly factor BamB